MSDFQICLVQRCRLHGQVELKAPALHTISLLYPAVKIVPHLYCARIGTHLNKKKHKPKEKGAAKLMANPFFSLRSYGAEGQNRTADTGIFRIHISSIPRLP